MKKKHKKISKSKKNTWGAGPFMVVAVILVMALAVNLLVQAPTIDLPEAGHAPEYKDMQEGTNPGAPVTLVEFVDMQCPFCAQFHETVNQLRAEFGEDLNYVVRHSPNHASHPQAVLAAVAVECLYWEGKRDAYMDLLFANQADLSRGALTRYAVQVGMSQQEFESCLADQSVAELVQNHLFEAQKVGLRGTPTIFINGARLEGAQDINRLRELISAIITTKEQ